MRWSIIKLIWMRELRDQLRDRRTLFMIAVLPLLLYPVLGIGVLSIARDLLTQQNTVGVCNVSALPQHSQRASAGTSGVPVAAWFATVPIAPVSGADWLTSSFAMAQLRQSGLKMDYPPLIVTNEETHNLEFAVLQDFMDPAEPGQAMEVRDKGELGIEDFQAKLDYIGNDPTRCAEFLREKKVDILVVVAPDCLERLERDDRPAVWVLSGFDDRSRNLSGRVRAILERWDRHAKKVRLFKRGLASNYDKPIQILDAERPKSPEGLAKEKVVGLLGKIFPFLLVMWSLAGALYPAVDLCAGEKERGTMETLLITPTSREEIVYGKFLAIWVFSAATALLNLLSMAITTWKFVAQIPGELFQPSALVWCLVLLLPLSAFFSALCLAIGAYARSSKEGQYYLMPLFLVTMPLIFITLVPGIKLEPLYAMVPVTGVALLLQRLLETHPQTPTEVLTTWLYFLPVLGPMLIYGWLALRWAVLQFQREEVLFREAERLDVRLWLRSLTHEKRPLVSAGQAMFCFGVIFALRWFTFRWSAAISALGSLGVSYLAFVLAPTLLSVFALNRRPLLALGIRKCSWRPALMAVVLALLLLVPMTELSRWVLQQLPEVQKALHEESPVQRALETLATLGDDPALCLLVIGLLAPLCEELAFRGLVLNGLLRSFRPWTAVLLSSFLYAIFNASVFNFVPCFVLGVVLATFTVRTRSILPAMFFHCTYNTLLILPAFGPADFWVKLEPPPTVRLVLIGLFLLTAVCLLGRLWIRGYRLLEVNDPALEAVAADSADPIDAGKKLLAPIARGRSSAEPAPPPRPRT